MSHAERERPAKAEVVKTERRRRKSGPKGARLTISQDIIKKHPDMEFRWGVDDEGRMQQLTQNDDWDKVPGVDTIHAGVGKAGNAIKHHLLMKPKAYMEADREEKMSRLLDAEKAALSKPEKDQAMASGSEEYSVPGNKLGD